MACTWDLFYLSPAKSAVFKSASIRLRINFLLQHALRQAASAVEILR